MPYFQKNCHTSDSTCHDIDLVQFLGWWSCLIVLPCRLVNWFINGVQIRCSQRAVKRPPEMKVGTKTFTFRQDDCNDLVIFIPEVTLVKAVYFNIIYFFQCAISIICKISILLCTHHNMMWIVRHGCNQLFYHKVSNQFNLMTNIYDS